MSRIPKGFGGGSGKDKAPLVKVVPSKQTKKPVHTKVPADVHTKDPLLKRKHDHNVVIEDLTKNAEDAPHKKHKSTAGSSVPLISSELSTLPIFITDEEVQSWKGLSGEDEEDAMIKASTQMLVHSIRRANDTKKDRARLQELEKDKASLTQANQTLEAQIKKLKENHSTAAQAHKKEIDANGEIITGLNKCIDNLNTEIKTLRARLHDLEEEKESGWLAEKEKIKEDAFADGFENYAIGFLANDYDYNFTKFGQDTVDYIANFKIEHAKDIQERRVELGLEASSPVDGNDKGAPSPEGGPEPFNTVKNPEIAASNIPPNQPEINAADDGSIPENTATETSKDAPAE